jgi:hypothetical protein
VVGFWTPITPETGLLFHADAQLYELYAALVTGPHAQHTEREMARLQAELEQAEQARRRWWHRWLKR